MARLDDIIALVTGAGRGIGEACAEALVAEGATVAVTDLNGRAAEKVARRLGDAAYPFALDVRNESMWIEVVGEIAQNIGRLGVLVNNAGVTGFDGLMCDAPGPHDPEHASLDAWRAVHETNLDGVFLGCKHAISAMKPPTGDGGSIINISSRSGQVGIPRAAAYASSKAAVRNHTKSVALYCAEGRYGIRCNAICPGPILTPMWEPMLGSTPDESERAIAGFAGEVPIGRMGSPSDVAALVVYLASEESSFVTGAEFTIDGGILAGSAATPRPEHGA
ncbi:MAG: SDR family oxidoreductase [Planctomycetota bacterium]